MRRAIGGLIAVLPLALGVAVAHADQGGGDGGSQGVSGIPVIGTVVSTDPTTGTFTANAYVSTQSSDDGSDQGDAGSSDQSDDSSSGSGSGSGSDSGSSSGTVFGGDIAKAGDMSGPTPPTTLVTITTNASTIIQVNGSPGTVGGMTAGDHFVAFFTGAPTDSIQTLTANPALQVIDETPPLQEQVYAFVGTVTGTDPTNGTVTITVTRSLPSALAPANSSVTLSVTADTLVLGGSSSSLFGGSLTDVSTGDIVAGGLLAPSGDTLAQIEALPLRVLLDLPVSSSSSTSSAQVAKEKRKALQRALRLLGDKSVTTKHHKSRKYHSHKGHKKA
jgi:hypothetical protein